MKRDIDIVSLIIVSVEFRGSIAGAICSSESWPYLAFSSLGKAASRESANRNNPCKSLLTDGGVIRWCAAMLTRLRPVQYYRMIRRSPNPHGPT